MEEIKVSKINKYCNEHKSYNYGKMKIRKLFSKKEIFNAICTKQQSREKLPTYKNCYSWLKIYDDEIDFLIDYCLGLQKGLWI